LPEQGRIVEDRNRITGGGVTSGIDFDSFSRHGCGVAMLPEFSSYSTNMILSRRSMQEPRTRRVPR
jgi:hypothetical protein